MDSTALENKHNGENTQTLNNNNDISNRQDRSQYDPAVIGVR